MDNSNLNYIHSPSANFKDEVIIPKYIIFHCIGGTEEQALTTLTKPLPLGGGVSSHYFIPQHNSNTVYQLVPANKMAFHAGSSAWQDDNDLNHCSIGIELHCPNYANALDNTLDWFHFEPFNEQQITICIALVQMLQQKFAITSKNILAHSDIAPWRTNQQGEIILGKTDPGATFPWEQLAACGIGIWPKQERLSNAKIDTSIAHLQKLLKQYGYNIPLSGKLDLAPINEPNNKPRLIPKKIKPQARPRW